MVDGEPTGLDGDDPLGEAGPVSCEASPADCEQLVVDGEASVDQCEYPAAAEIDEPFPVEALRTVLAPDGLPDHSLEDPTQGEAAPFTYEGVICVADDREYVELFLEEVATRHRATFAIHAHGDGEIYDVDYLCHGAPIELKHRFRLRMRYDAAGVERERTRFGRDEVVERWGAWTAARFDKRELVKFLVFVRPVREVCRYYKRQLFPIDGEPTMKVIFRNCTHPARRSIGGAALSLRDEAVFACDYRDPLDAIANASLDASDRKKLDTEPHRTRLPLFGTVGDKVGP